MPTKATVAYAELHCHSNFSFLEGASHPEELVERAVELGLPAVALTDRHGLYGAVRFSKAARAAGLQAIVGAEVVLSDTATPSHLTLLVEDETGYRNLASLISQTQLAGRKGQPCLTWELLAQHADGLIALSGCWQGELATHLREQRPAAALAAARRYQALFGRQRFWVEVQHHRLPGDRRLGAELVALAERAGLGVVATNNVHYARRERKPLHDVLTCIKHHTTLDRAGALLSPNAEYCLKSAREMAALFHEYPQAIANTLRVAERCQFRLADLGYRFPVFPVPAGQTAFSYLYQLCHQGALERYDPITPPVLTQLAHELAVIQRLGLAEYFLIVWDIMRFARQQGILGQGRGSAANSVVAYVLGITNVDPIKLDLLFERFLSEERAGMPDIDIDFANKDREKIIQYVYERYGRQHAGMVCEVITYRPRSAIRDVGKVLGLSLEQVDRLAKECDSRSLESLVPSLGAAGAFEAQRSHPSDLDSATQAPSPDTRDASPETRDLFLRLCRAIDGFPRHLGIHVGGMVITREPLIEVAPVERAAMPGRTVIQWDKDDAEDIGLVKIDILGLGMLSLIQDCLKLIEQHRGQRIDLGQLRYDDPEVYDMLCRADTIGLFQVESRAQINTLPRLKPRTFYDLVVEISLIRPGPIQGGSVHPYLRRRAGLEPVTYAHPSLAPVLGKTLGVPLFQEQGMKVAVVAAGFTPGKADELRRTMGHKRSWERMLALKDDLMTGMERNGIPAEAREQVWRQLSSFADYGFPESHAASFAHLVYASAWLKRSYPAEYLCAILNNQPMGFYPPAVLVADARRHGVEVRPLDVQRSRVECTLEESRVSGLGTRDSGPETRGLAVRLGYRYLRGIGKALYPVLDREAARGPYRSLADFCQRTGLERRLVERLIAVGAFDSFGIPRRQLLWQLPAALEAARADCLPNLRVGEPRVLDLESRDSELPRDPRPTTRDLAPLPPMTALEEANVDYQLLGLSTRYHALAFYRPRLSRLGAAAADALSEVRDGAWVRVGGLVICRQAPPTAKGHVFLTLEDETGLANVIVRPRVYQRYREIVRGQPAILVEGVLQRQDGALSIMARRFAALSHAEVTATVPSRDFR